LLLLLLLLTVLPNTADDAVTSGLPGLLLLQLLKGSHAHTST
jgi:hypothetical protein